MLSNFPNGVSSFGIPVLPTGTGVFTGTAWFVKPYSGNDGNSGKSPDQAFKTLATALASATANKNDVVYLIAESNTASLTSDYQATALDWNKDGVHLIGVGAGSMLGQRSRIAQLSTVLTIEDLFTVSADNCLIANIEVYQGVASSTATSPRAMVVSGQRNRIVNCQISGMGDTSMDTAGARSLHVSGSENIFQHCYIGLDTVIRATNAAETSVTSAARTIFEDCIFNTYTSNTALKLCAITSLDRFVIFKNCEFNAAAGITSAAAPTGAISNTTPNGRVVLHNPCVSGIVQITTADDTGTLALGHDGTATGHKVGIATAIDAA